MLIALLVLIVLSLFMSNINIMAHLGGFIGGVLITLIGYYFTHIVIYFGFFNYIACFVCCITSKILLLKRKYL